MFFKEKMLGKDQLEYSLNSTEQREPQVCWFSGVVVGFGIGLIGEYDNAKDDAEIMPRKQTGQRPAGVLLCAQSNLEHYMMIQRVMQDRGICSRLPCYVFFLCMLTQQEVVTPYTPRIFAISAPPAREGQMDRLFLQKEHFTYKSQVKKQKQSKCK